MAIFFATTSIKFTVLDLLPDSDDLLGYRGDIGGLITTFSFR